MGRGEMKGKGQGGHLRSQVGSDQRSEPGPEQIARSMGPQGLTGPGSSPGRDLWTSPRQRPLVQESLLSPSVPRHEAGAGTAGTGVG